MRKIIVTAILMTLALNANAECFVDSTSGLTVSNELNKTGWKFGNYAEICNKLKKANAQLVISAQATVLSGTSIGWASVTLMDKDLPISTTEHGGHSTRVNAYGSQDVATGLMMDAINSAIEYMVIDKAIQSLNDRRKKVAAAHKK